VDTLLIAHRGASGYAPENTLAAFQLGIDLGADCLELDVVPTRDGRLVVRHESELSLTTDVATRPEFAHRWTTKVIDGRTRCGWFTEDFDLSEVQVLRTKERMRRTRSRLRRYDGQHAVPSLEEVLQLTARSSGDHVEAVGVYVELKSSTYFGSIGLGMEGELVRVLREHGYDGPDARVWLESLETTNLRMLRELGFNVVQLVRSAGRPYDLRAQGDGRRYADLVTRSGLRQISDYAVAVALEKDLVIPRDGRSRLGRPTPVIADADRVGLPVLAWTFRAENRFLPTELRLGTDPYAVGDLEAEVQAFVAAGVQGVFTDHPDIGRRSPPTDLAAAKPSVVNRTKGRLARARQLLRQQWTPGASSQGPLSRAGGP